MLTVERITEIGKTVKSWQRHERRADDYPVADVLDMLVDLATELDRLRQPTPTPHAKGHLRPVLLDNDGKPIMPQPLAQQFAVDRRAQFDEDRFEAITMPVDLDRWRVFCLRWGLAPPPSGWGSVEQITNVIHAIRIGVKRVPYVDKHFSAVYLTSRGIALPPPAKLVQGQLHGVELPDSD